MSTIVSTSSATPPGLVRRIVGATLVAGAVAFGASLAHPAIASAETKAPGPNPVGPQPNPVHSAETTCFTTDGKGNYNFFLPGEIDGGWICGADGKWHALAP
jgi:hypothetical protein